MSHFIVFAGKGGTGKSSLAAIAIRYLVEKGVDPSIAIDADPNYCLPELLGIDEFTTLAQVRESVNRKKPEGFSLDDWLELEVNRIIVESKGFDLLVMGRPEGRGCYCAINNVLKRVINDIARKYRFVVVDNEAGMEHISRGILNRIDTLFVIATQAKNSIEAALRINALVNELEIFPKRRILIINQKNHENLKNDTLRSLFDAIHTVNFDQNLKAISEKGESIFNLPRESVALLDFYKILEEEIERKI